MEMIVEWTIAYHDGKGLAELMDRQIEMFFSHG